MKKLSIGKVSEIVDLPQSVLRYWETMFEVFNPEKSEGGTRRYSQADVDIILEIKDLLYKKKFTIAGAQSSLSNRSATPLSLDLREHLKDIGDEIDDILNDLTNGDNQED